MSFGPFGYLQCGMKPGDIAPPVFYYEGKPFEMNAAGIYVPHASLLADVQGRRRFIIDHDDSHLFMRGTVKGTAEERDEQRILRGIQGGGEYVWSEALQSHVRLA